MEDDEEEEDEEESSIGGGGGGCGGGGAVWAPGWWRETGQDPLEGMKGRLDCWPLLTLLILVAATEAEKLQRYWGLRATVANCTSDWEQGSPRDHQSSV